MTLWRNKVDITRVTKFQCKRLCKNSFTLCSLQFLEKYEYQYNEYNVILCFSHISVYNSSFLESKYYFLYKNINS